jgi:N utilization substance protein B
MNDTLPEEPRAVRPFVGGRSNSRERAVHLLYESSMKGISGAEVLVAQKAAADAYTTEVVRGVGEHLNEIDALIESLAPDGWRLERMAQLDLTIMRVACWELSHSPDVPTGVVLSEAVGLAEEYGTDDSHRFVNGLLAAAAASVRDEEGRVRD